MVTFTFINSILFRCFGITHRLITPERSAEWPSFHATFQNCTLCSSSFSCSDSFVFVCFQSVYFLSLDEGTSCPKDLIFSIVRVVNFFKCFLYSVRWLSIYQTLTCAQINRPPFFQSFLIIYLLYFKGRNHESECLFCRLKGLHPSSVWGKIVMFRSPASLIWPIIICLCPSSCVEHRRIPLQILHFLFLEN